MPPKKKGAEPKIPLLPPQIFEASVAKLNIHVGVGQHATTTTTIINTNNPTSNSITCTNEAMEFLRHAHGQFVALISSELASGQDSKPKRKRKNVDVDVSVVEEENGENEIRTIMPKHVKTALERLEFHDILASTGLNENECMDDDGDQDKKMGMKPNVTTKSTTTNITVTAPTISKAAKRRKVTKMKELLKDDATTADLLKEQEQLFARSAAKAKEAHDKKR